MQDIRLQFIQDASLDDILLTLSAKAYSAKVQELMEQLDKLSTAKTELVGHSQDVLRLLKPDEIIYFYTENKKVFARCADDTSWQVDSALYKLENTLSQQGFIRSNQSELVNRAHIKQLKLSWDSSIQMQLTGGYCSYISRRQLKHVKSELGL